MQRSWEVRCTIFIELCGFLFVIWRRVLFFQITNLFVFFISSEKMIAEMFDVFFLLLLQWVLSWGQEDSVCLELEAGRATSSVVERGCLLLRGILWGEFFNSVSHVHKVGSSSWYLEGIPKSIGEKFFSEFLQRFLFFLRIVARPKI